jgi:hypothetical protein
VLKHQYQKESKVMSNLVKIEGVPDYLQPLINESGENQEAFGALKPADFGIGFVKLVQQMSREVKPGPNGEPGLPLGKMFVSRDRSIILSGTPFIPLYRKVSYIRWLGKPGDGKMDFATDREDDPRIRKIDGLSFRKNPQTGESEPPLVTTYVNFYLWSKAFEAEPLILSFYRTGTQVGRRLTQDLFRATKGAKLPLYSLMFKFGEPTITRDGQLEWYQFNVVPNGYTPEKLMPKAAEMFDLAKTLATASTGVEFSALEDSEASRLSTPTGPSPVLEGNAIMEPLPSAAPTVAAPVPQPVPATQADNTPEKTSMW